MFKLVLIATYSTGIAMIDLDHGKGGTYTPHYATLEECRKAGDEAIKNLNYVVGFMNKPEPRLLYTCVPQ